MENLKVVNIYINNYTISKILYTLQDDRSSIFALRDLYLYLKCHLNLGFFTGGEYVLLANDPYIQ